MDAGGERREIVMKLRHFALPGRAKGGKRRQCRILEADWAAKQRNKKTKQGQGELTVIGYRGNEKAMKRHEKELFHNNYTVHFFWWQLLLARSKGLR